jgi:transketolase
MRDRFVNVTASLLDENPQTALILADIGVSLFKEAGVVDRYPHRVVNIGIREQLLISFASGMALEGFRPIVHTYAPFLVERPYEQLKLDLVHQGIGVVLVSVGASYDAAAAGRTHQASEDVALIGTLPGWQVHVPGHPDEVEILLRNAASTTECVYIRLSDETNQTAVDVQPGQLKAIRQGTSKAATVIAIGPVLDQVTEAVKELDVTVLYTNTPRPFDAEALQTELQAPEVVIVEPYLEGTSSAEITSALSNTPHRLLSIGVPRDEHRHYGDALEHRAAYGLDADGIRQRIERFLSGK